MDYNKLKSKRQKWLERALILAIVLIVIVIAIFSITPKTETTPEGEVEEVKKPIWQSGWIKFFIGIGVGALLFYIHNRRKNVIHLQNFEVIKLVADTIHKEKGIYLNTSFNNVTVQKGGADEVYVQFQKEFITFLFEQGVGITEIYNGKTITDVINAKSKDVIQMKMAEIGIADKKIMKDMERLGRIGEEV